MTPVSNTPRSNDLAARVTLGTCSITVPFSSSDRSLTVSWLAKEFVARYRRQYLEIPQISSLSLQTSSTRGLPLEQDRLLSELGHFVTDGDTVIHFQTSIYGMTPLSPSERYSTLCDRVDVEPISLVQNSLTSMGPLTHDQTFSLSLPSCGLDRINVEPIFLAIEDRIQSMEVLDISLNPFLGNAISGFIQNKWEKLLTLDFSATGLTLTGLRHISKSLISGEMPRLRHLDVGFNPLGREPEGCARIVSDIYPYVQLRRISFSRCLLSSSFLPALLSALCGLSPRHDELYPLNLNLSLNLDPCPTALLSGVDSVESLVALGKYFNSIDLRDCQGSKALISTLRENPLDFIQI
mmetsp:Transcript_12485/g.25380  ORF Transcript_12485/g.25380 Transcript_12485/m.25380 type:complete len:352 (+) Transcript_12485:2073-3128(+)